MAANRIKSHERSVDRGRTEQKSPASRSRKTTEHHLDLQNEVGNRAVGLLLQTMRPSEHEGKSLEREAQQRADALVRMNIGDSPESKVHSSISPAATSLSLDSGEPLTSRERNFFEPRLGKKLGAVRVHTGVEAAWLAHELGTAAFAVGTDIGFGEGEYRPDTSRGQRILAHELAHVVQQSLGQTHGRLLVQTWDPPTSSEQEAAAPAESPELETSRIPPRTAAVPDIRDDTMRAANQLLEHRRRTARLQQMRMIPGSEQEALTEEPDVPAEIADLSNEELESLILERFRERGIELTREKLDRAEQLAQSERQRYLGYAGVQITQGAEARTTDIPVFLRPLSPLPARPESPRRIPGRGDLIDIGRGPLRQSIRPLGTFGVQFMSPRSTGPRETETRPLDVSSTQRALRRARGQREELRHAATRLHELRTEPDSLLGDVLAVTANWLGEISTAAASPDQEPPTSSTPRQRNREDLFNQFLNRLTQHTIERFRQRVTETQQLEGAFPVLADAPLEQLRQFGGAEDQQARAILRRIEEITEGIGICRIQLLSDEDFIWKYPRVVAETKRLLGIRPDMRAYQVIETRDQQIRQQEATREIILATMAIGFAFAAALFSGGLAFAAVPAMPAAFGVAATGSLVLSTADVLREVERYEMAQATFQTHFSREEALSGSEPSRLGIGLAAVGLLTDIAGLAEGLVAMSRGLRLGQMAENTLDPGRLAVLRSEARIYEPEIVIPGVGSKQRLGDLMHGRPQLDRWLRRLKRRGFTCKPDETLMDAHAEFNFEARRFRYNPRTFRRFHFLHENRHLAAQQARELGRTDILGRWRLNREFATLSDEYDAISYQLRFREHLNPEYVEFLEDLYDAYSLKWQ